MLFSSLRKLIDQLSRSPRRRGRRSQEVRPRKRSRLLLDFDRLEDRLSPAVIAWDGGPSGTGTDWHVAANWVGDVLPAAADDAQIGAAFSGITITSNADVTIRSVNSAAAINVSGGTFSLGVAGGPLVMALVLGWLGRTGPIGWRMPMVANLVLRNLGLSVFIGSVAIGAGAPFVQTVASNGVQILLGGAAVLLTLVGVVLVVGYLLRIPFDDLLGVCAGSTGNPAILSAAGRLAPTDRTDIGYAICFPSTTIAKIIAVQVLLS